MKRVAIIPDEKVIKYIAENHDKVSKAQIRLACRLGSDRMSRLWDKAESMGLVTNPLYKQETKDGARDHIKKLYGTMQRDKILKIAGIGYTKYYEILRDLIAKGEVEPIQKTNKKTRLKTETPDEDLVKMWSDMTCAQVCKILGCGESKARQMVNEARGRLNHKPDKSEEWFQPRESMQYLASSWVPTKYVNHNCRWLAA